MLLWVEGPLCPFGRRVLELRAVLVLVAVISKLRYCGGAPYDWNVIWDVWDDLWAETGLWLQLVWKVVMRYGFKFWKQRELQNMSTHRSEAVVHKKAPTFIEKELKLKQHEEKAYKITVANFPKFEGKVCISYGHIGINDRTFLFSVLCWISLLQL